MAAIKALGMDTLFQNYESIRDQVSTQQTPLIEGG